MRFPLPLPLGARRAAQDEVGAAYATADLPRGRTPWRETRWCAVDLELTGLDPREHEIISFGAIPIEDGRVQLQAAVEGLVRPAGAISEASIRVHGIRAADLARAPRLADAIGSLLQAITGRVLVVHAAAVERAFLGRALRARGLRLRGPLIDTEVLGRVWLHERDGRAPGSISLGDLASALGLPADRPHHALGDALTTAQVFIALAAHLDALHRETVGTLARSGRGLERLRAFDGR
jgi:DNA polymerase III subunit epsilon